MTEMEARATAVRAQPTALLDAELRRFLAYLTRRNTAAIEVPIAEFLANLAVQAEWAGW